MNKIEKISMLRTMMYIEDTSEDEVLSAYLTAAEKEILAWRYSLAENKPTEVPPEYEMTQIFAVIAGYSQIGAEGQTKHSEGSIERIFSYDTMIAYIRKNVIPIVGCI